MKTSILVTLLTFAAGFASAERNYVAWSTANAEYTGNSNITYQPIDTAVSAQGHTIVTGYQDNLQKDVWVTECYDALTGGVRWTATNSSATGEARPAAVAMDSLGNAYVGGFVDVTGEGANFCLIKYGPGGQIWKRTYNNTAKAGEDKIVAVITDEDNDVYVTGHSMGTSSEDYYTIKYDPSGNVVWEKRYATSYQDRPSAMASMFSMEFNGLAVTGKSQVSNTACFTTLVYDLANGNVKQTLHYDTSEYDEATSVAADSYGIYVTGLVKLPSSSNYAVHTVRYTPASNTHQWARVFTSPGGHEGGVNFQPKVGTMGLNDTGVLMACSSKLDGFKTVCSLTRYNSAGVQGYSKTNAPDSVPSGTFITDNVMDLTMDRMGNAIVAGTCYTQATGQDPLVVKFNGNDGSIHWQQRWNGSAAAGIDRAVAVAVSPEDNVAVANFMDRGDQNNYYNMVTARVNTLILSKGDFVFGGGVKPGATVNSVGTPCLMFDGSSVVKATVKSGSSVLNALISSRGGNQVIALQGQPVQGITGAKYATFSDPVSGGGYRFLSVITMTGTPTGQGSALLVDNNGSPGVHFQTGKQIPDLPMGTLLSSISNVAPELGVLYLMVTLKGTGITSANNVALIQAVNVGESFSCKYLVQKGQAITANGKTSAISSISMFSPPVGATGHSRYTGWGRSTFIATLADGRKVAVMNNSGTNHIAGVTGGPTFLGANTVWSAFAVPGVSPQGDNLTTKFIMSATLKAGVGGVTSANDTAIIYSENGSNGHAALAREGSLAPGAGGAKYAALSAPISAGPGYAFKSTLTGTGVTTSNNQAIFRATNAANVSLMLRTGMNAPDARGNPSTALFNSFTNIAWPGYEAGPTVHATLRGTGITTANNQALFAFDSGGAMRQVLRTGQQWGTLKVKSFTVLNSVAKGMCSPRSTNDEGFITALITFTNLSQSIVRIAMP